LKVRDELLTIKNKMRKDIEEAKIKEENYIKTIKRLEVELPRQKAQLIELDEEEKHYRNIMKQLLEQMDVIEMKSLELRNEIADVNNFLVSDQEADSIQSAKESVENQLEEQETIIASLRKKLKEYSLAIGTLESDTMKMEALYDASNVDTNAIRAKKKSLETIQKEISKLKLSLEEVSAEIESTTQAIAVKTRNNEQLKLHIKETIKSLKSQESKQKKTLKEKENVLTKLMEDEATCIESGRKLADERDFLVEYATEILQKMSTS